MKTEDAPPAGMPPVERRVVQRPTIDRETKQALLTATDMQGLSAEFLEVLADAERYRWLRTVTEDDDTVLQRSTGTELDATIDELMARAKDAGAA